MAARTANLLKQRFRPGVFEQYQDYEIADAVQLYLGGYVAFDSNGRLVAFSGANGQTLVGRVVPGPGLPLTGAANPTALKGDTAGKPPARATVFTGSDIIEKVAVTGLSANMSQNGQSVYLNSTDNFEADLTLTPPATGAQPFGILWNVYGTTQVADVLVFGLGMTSVTRAAARDQVLMIGSFAAGANGFLHDAAGVAGLLLPAPFHGKIVSCFALNTGVTMTGGPVTVTPTIATTPTTGGDMILTATLANKAKVAGSTITAANEFHQGDALDLVSSTVTAFTAGQVAFYLVLRPLSGV